MKQLNNDNFENAWQKAFDEASVAPPSAIWENIEKTLPPAIGVGNVDNVGGSKIATTTKILWGTGLVIIASLGLFMLKNETNKTQSIIVKPTVELNKTGISTIKQLNYEADAQKTIQPKPLDTKPKQQKLDDNITINTQTPIIEREINALLWNENESLKIAKVEPVKSEEKAFEALPKGITITKTKMNLPVIDLQTDSQIVNTYFDPNAIQIKGNKKGKFWQNFKVRGTIGVGQGIGSSTNSGGDNKK
jgi:hypothetical protein